MTYNNLIVYILANTCENIHMYIFTWKYLAMYVVLLVMFMWKLKQSHKFS